MARKGSPEQCLAEKAGQSPGSNEALRALHERHSSALLSYLMRLTNGDRHRAEDMLQETVIRAWRHPEARTDGHWSRPWLFMVARRIAIDHARACLARPTEIGDEWLHERPDTRTDIERLSDRADMMEALQELPDRYRCVLVEIYLRDRSVATTAAILGIPEGTVRSRTFYGLRTLRQRFVRHGLMPAGVD